MSGQNRGAMLSVRSTFMFAIDAYWITHAYAAVFLILLYERGCIDCESCNLNLD